MDTGSMDNTNPTSRLLLLCLQTRWRPEALDEARALVSGNDVAWGSLLDVARAEGVAPLLYHAVRGEGLLPSTVEQTLRGDYFANASRNVLLLRALEDALQALERESVPVITLKGAALAETVYGNVAVRPMGDLDLLVRERQVPTAARVLLELGYRSGQRGPFDVQDIHSNQLLLRRGDSSSEVIEIHWQLFWFPYYRRVVPVEWFWTTALPVDLGKTEGLMLAPEAHVLHLCGHLLHHHGSDGAFRLLWMHDVAALVMYYAKEIDWEEVLDRAQAYQLVQPVQQILTRVKAIWSVPIPAEVMGRLRGMRPSPGERQALEWLTETSASMETYALAGLASMPTWRERLQFAWHDLLFPSPGFMRSRYHVPHPLLLPFYYPYRWLAGLWGVVRSRRMGTPQRR
jgi:hypothetical protein